MRKFTFIFLLTLLQNSFGQITDGNLNIKIQSAHYDFQPPDTAKFGIEENSLETLNLIYVWVIIDGFDLDHPIDFNNFSLVEIEYKIRRRPSNVGFKQYYLEQINLNDFRGQDNFLKYSQEGITDYDHYRRWKLPFKKLVVQQERFYPLRILPQKNKKKEFLINFYVKNQDQGEFSLYYKNTLIKTFFMKVGDYPKFK